jgi:hypothetical protein
MPVVLAAICMLYSWRRPLNTLLMLPQSAHDLASDKQQHQSTQFMLSQQQHCMLTWGWGCCRRCQKREACRLT